MNRLRQIILIVVFLGATLLSFAQQPASSCTYTLELYDSANNGWDGAYLEVSIDGGPNTVYSVPSGGLSTYTLAVNNGSTIDANYVSAANEAEHSFSFFDALGNVIYSDGPTPTYGPITTLKAACPETCTFTENYVILITTGHNPDQMSWELRDGAGARVAYANAGTYTNLPFGTEVPIPVVLDICEDYILTVFDAANNSWMQGTFEILTLNKDRGTPVIGGSFDAYHSILAGPGFFFAEKDFEFTLPCLACPASQIVEAPNAISNNCELNGFVYPSADVPTPVICYPNGSHGTPAPTVTISYPTATPAIANNPVWVAANLPVGINPVIFEVSYTDGQVIRCTSEVIIVSDPNPSVAANDLVTIPLPDVGINDCLVHITPDMVLEAPGMCEGEFIVTVYDLNGNSLGSNIGANEVGQTLDYEVHHITGNIIGWGQITVEDKLAPHINCFDYTISCNNTNAFDENYLVDEIFFPLAGTLPANIAGGSFFPAPPSVTALNFEVECAPLGEVVYNVKVKLDISHTDIGDLRIELVDPNGLTSMLMTPWICDPGAGQDLTVIFDSGSTAPSITSACESPNVPAINGTYAPIADITYAGAAYDNLAGTWQVIITDINNTTFPDGEVGLGEVIAAELIISKGFPLPFAAEDCSAFDVTLVTEMLNETNCTEPWIGAEIMRIWRAVDASGNSTTCEQIVSLRSPAFSELELPEDLDLECGSDPGVDNTGLPVFGCFELLDDQDNICDMSFTYVDTEIPTCGQGRKVIREWTIINWCASTTLNHTQIIKIEDTTGPTITAQDITTGTSTYDCGAEIALSTYVTDECSAVTQITASYTVGGGPYNGSGILNIIDITNTGVLTGLPLGATEVVIQAKDACGNFSLDTIDVNVIDDVSPAAICDDQLHVTLQGDGTARIYAGDIDEGSFDNCEIASLEVRRTGGCLGASQFDQYVDFVCCDTEELVEVELKVTDANGNSSICWANVTVEDKLAPIITCPPHKTIDCDEDFSDPSVFGDAVVLDNCGATVSVIDDVDVDNCRAGTITRTFTAEDAYGNAQSCEQLITINHISDFAVIFPADVVLNNCTDDPGIIGEPVIQNEDCELIAVSHTDQVYNVVPDACYKIVRTWTVINWCNYDLNDPNNTNLGLALPLPNAYKDDGDGYFTYTQVLKIIDQEGPSFDLATVQDITVDVNNGCSASVSLPDAIANDDCSGELIVNPNPSFLTGNAGDVLQATYETSDGCGNSISKVINVSFIDNKAPTPICINGLSIQISQNGTIDIWASDFDSGSSYDNCTARSGLKYSFSSDVNETSIIFDCNQLGTNTIELWVTDEAGNQDYCSTYVIVQDNMDYCSGNGTGSSSIDLGGKVYNENGIDVEDVTVNLSGGSAAPYNTASSGNYHFNNLAMYSNYTITPAKDVNPLNGITTYDLVLISQHILGTSPLNSPYKLIAADVNSSGSVTTFDIVQLRQLILYVITDFPSNESWRFIEADYNFPVPSNPWSAPFPELINQTNAQLTDMDLNFVGVKVGDVNCSAIPGQYLGSESRSFNETLYLSIDDKKIHAGEKVKVDFKASDFEKMNGFQYTLKFDEEVLTYEAFEAANLDMSANNFGFAMMERGIITCSWHNSASISLADDEVLFSLVFESSEEASIKDLLFTSSKYTVAEAYSLEGAGLMDVGLVFNEMNEPIAQHAAIEFELFQNKPNPFNGFTQVGFVLPQADQAVLNIFDVNGKLLKSYRGDYNKGYNEVMINRSELNASGVLYYELTSGSFRATKKMIMMN